MNPKLPLAPSISAAGFGLTCMRIGGSTLYLLLMHRRWHPNARHSHGGLVLVWRLQARAGLSFAIEQARACRGLMPPRRLRESAA